MSGNEHQVVLVSCVAAKRTVPSPAKDLYLSALFKATRAYAETQSTKWYILSAKYGLLSPDDVVSPYELTLNGIAIAQRRVWAQRVHAQLLSDLPAGARVVFLAGKRYREFIAPLLTAEGFDVVAPMEGLGIGQQLQWLRRAMGPKNAY